MQTKSDLLHDLHKTMTELIVDLYEIFTEPAEKEDLYQIEIFHRRSHPETTMSRAVKHLLPHKQKIVSRDLDYFKNHTRLFDGLATERVAYYKESIANRVSEENMSVLWDYLDAALAFVEAYKKDV